MKLLIFFLIFFLLFTPTVIAEGNHTLRIIFVDSTGNPITPVCENTYKIGLYANDIQLRVKSGLDFTNTSLKTTKGFYIFESNYTIPYNDYMIRAEHSYKIEDDENVKLLPVIVADLQPLHFFEESKIYPVLVHEVEGRPETFSMYDLAKQSEKTSNASLIFSAMALFLSCISVVTRYQEIKSWINKRIKSIISSVNNVKDNKNSIKLSVSFITVSIFVVLGCYFSKYSVEYGTLIIIAAAFTGCTHLIDFITCNIYEKKINK